MEHQGKSSKRRLIAALFLACAALGCRSSSHEVARPVVLRAASASAPCTYVAWSPELVAATAAQSERLIAEADDLDRRQIEQCVDLYYKAALQSARVMTGSGGSDSAASQTYELALAGLMDAAQRYGRLDPRKQLTVNDGGPRVVPIRYLGFAWRPADFSRLEPACSHESTDISRRYATPGLGMPLVGVRVADQPDELFFRPEQPFAVTAVLRPAGNNDPTSNSFDAGGSGLELYNSHVFDAVAWNGSTRPLARDLTAPYAAVESESPRQYLRGFTAPSDTSVQPKLIMVEPYQRGKIPVVFIHGLYSDPITWVDTANDLLAESDIYQRYQFWVYRYPTGSGVMNSAAQLRNRLRLARKYYDPDQTDAAFGQMMLVGHSLGGLIAKMQVVTSYDLMWNQVADQPFSQVQAVPKMEMRLASDFFFEPVSLVTSVVFIGTPHQGSNLSRRLAGRIGSSLVSNDPEEDALYRELMEENSDVFKPSVARSRPTSVDLLEPTSPLLLGLQQTPYKPGVQLHSIIGTGGTAILREPGDGVVAVSSARICGVESELLVSAKHEKLHRDPASIAELARILRQHANRAPVAMQAQGRSGREPSPRK